MSTFEKTAADLEWYALLEQLAERCRSRAGAERARALLPDATLEGARERMRRTAEAMELTEQGDPIPLDGLVELGDFLLRLAREGIATAAELHALRQLLHTAHTLRRYAGVRRETHRALAEALHSEPSLDKLMDTLDFALDPDGGLADRASTDLAHARRKAGEMRQRVVARLEELIHRYAEVLQDRYYTVRDGRYVLPVRSDTHIKVPGIVLGSSASGATLFIEPGAVMALGNQLKVAMADVEREEARVLAELSERARRQVEEIERAYEACVVADVLAATARLGGEMEARALEPEPEPVLELRAARHPLLALAGITVVPNDLRLESGRVLVISGPNAGGKTVALKCLGLAALMVRSGLPVPVAEGSRIGWLDPVLSDVGDDQSLTRSLSTFSAHITNLARILSHAHAGSLVLLDELAGGTDPEEGAALAAALLEQLASRGAAVAVTTHYELLKTLAVRETRFVNASVGFDLRTMLPTFTVTMGIPGASSALAVAARYGIPSEVVARAQAMLPEHAVGREDVLRRIQDEQVAAQMARRAAEDEAREVARLRLELESERNLQRTREQSKVSRQAQDLLEALRRAREELRAAEVRVRRKKATEEDLREASRAVDRVAAQVAIGGALAGAVPRRGSGDGEAVRRPARVEELRPGQRVYVPRIGSMVEVLDPPARGQVRVAAGPLKLFVSVDEVQMDETPAPSPTASGPAKREASPSLRRVSGVTAPVAVPAGPDVPHRTESNTCDVRGLRADDALSMVDAFLDRLVGAGGSSGFVLHGHGTGALKLAVREHLRSSPYVRTARAASPEDGGDAFTVFWMNG
jgi:DNA mismatch repair protein MutS2